LVRPSSPRRAERAPEGADGNGWQVKVDGDLREGLVVEVATDDFLAGGAWDGAGHR
jgi:hypothetical protein